MIQAMYSGISGMNAFKSALDVIGNNVANINTTAYKAGRANFKDMLSQAITAATSPSANPRWLQCIPNRPWAWSSAPWTSIPAQGSMQATGRDTDLAIEGNGFFTLGGGSKIAYTRDGGFSLDAEFNLTPSGSGMKVLGWSADLDTGQSTPPRRSPRHLESKSRLGGLSVARATSEIDVAGNLDASSAGPSQTTFVNLVRNLDSRPGPKPPQHWRRYRQLRLSRRRWHDPRCELQCL